MIKLEKFVREQQFQSVNTATLAANRKRPEKDILTEFDENLTNGVPDLYPLGKKVVKEEVTKTGGNSGQTGDEDVEP